MNLPLFFCALSERAQESERKKEKVGAKEKRKNQKENIFFSCSFVRRQERKRS
jgi:hypothetical protein